MICHKSLKRASFLARFGYDGSRFHGLQPNKGFVTAGGALYEVLQDAATIAPKALQFSARTDAGVHALENYATFWFPRPFNHELFLANLAASDKRGLLYVAAKQVHFKVHARANSRGKWYRYVIEDGDLNKTSNPFAWQIVPLLDIMAMQMAADHLIGTHAFDAFRHGGCSAGSTIKTISSIEVTATTLQPSGVRQIHIDIEGSAFLRRMVRIIAGTLAQVGAGLRPACEVEEILLSQRREMAGPSAPANGLSLMRLDFLCE